MRMRPGIIAQALDVRHRQPGGHGRVRVRREKGPGLRRMLILIEPEMKGALHIRHPGGHLHQHPVAVGAGDLKPVGPGEVAHGRIVRFRGAEPRGEIVRREITSVVRAGRIRHLRNQGLQAGRVFQGHADGQMQFPAGGQAACRRQGPDHLGHMSRQGLEKGGTGRILSEPQQPYPPEQAVKKNVPIQHGLSPVPTGPLTIRLALAKDLVRCLNLLQPPVKSKA